MRWAPILNTLLRKGLATCTFLFRELTASQAMAKGVLHDGFCNRTRPVINGLRSYFLIVSTTVTPAGAYFICFLTGWWNWQLRVSKAISISDSFPSSGCANIHETIPKMHYMVSCGLNCFTILSPSGYYARYSGCTKGVLQSIFRNYVRQPGSLDLSGLHPGLPLQSDLILIWYPTPSLPWSLLWNSESP